MIGIPKTGALEHSCISANVTTGYRFTTADGRPARLAIIDDQGNVVEAGETVAQETWNVCVTVIKKFMIGQGHIVVHSAPPGAAAQEIPRKGRAAQ
ncbi:hypothetical protein K8374_17875 [Pseudomonas sp. p1(2021b)]|uniref:hypothetical protein n=1 Tax=Pseudomonas sp. p1(2021b) TaxID=2874628 RepID=UPI001CD00A00|nr:hypothetical protein [Pseudomonas sp. p1(2021b)]UBM24225.1 hypothetical protein K8374_17875 [Pseudomonas sp. p1(2021b)]